MLARNGGQYKGKGTDLFSVCGSHSNRIRTTVVIDIHVTGARYIQGEWRATRHLRRHVAHRAGRVRLPVGVLQALRQRPAAEPLTRHVANARS